MKGYKGRDKTRILAIGSGCLHRALTNELVDDLNRSSLYEGRIYVGQPGGRETADSYRREWGAYR